MCIISFHWIVPYYPITSHHIISHVVFPYVAFAYSASLRAIPPSPPNFSPSAKQPSTLLAQPDIIRAICISYAALPSACGKKTGKVPIDI